MPMTIRRAALLGVLAILAGACRRPVSLPEGAIEGTECSPDAVSVMVRGTRLGPMDPQNGFINGISDPHMPNVDFPDRTVVERLHPYYWSVATPWQASIARSYGAVVTLSLYQEYADYDLNVRPYHDWPRWEAFMRDAAQRNLDAGRPVEWWDIWGEPPINQNPALVHESFERAIEVIRSVDPAARFGAPHLVHWNRDQMAAFMDYAVANDLRLDAFGWHEFQTAEEFTEHLAEFRALLRERPSLGDPEVHINEYSPFEQYLVPGFNLRWLEAFEAGGVAQAKRACWDILEGDELWSTCWDGLDGMFMRDSRTPQAVYWLYQRYSELSGERLLVEHPRGSAGLASVDDGRQQLHLLIGRDLPPGTAPRDMIVTIEVPSWAGSSLTVDINDIPYTNAYTQPEPLVAMVEEPSQTVGVEGGAVTVRLGCVAPGEVRELTLHP